MHDHDFEKQVHQKMVELRLEPSESVWEKVEKRLHGKEKRRPWIFWLPLLVVLMGTVGYFFVRHFPGFHGRINSSKAVSGSMEERKGTAKQNGVAARGSFQNVVVPKDPSFATPMAGRLPGKVPAGTAGKPAMGRPVQSLPRNNNVVYPGYTHPQSTGLPVDQEIQLPETTSIRTPGLAIPRLAEITFPVNTSLIIPGEPRFIRQEEKMKQDRWEWGLHLQAGRSALNSGKLNRLFASADAMSSRSNLSPGGNTFYRPPSPLEAGFGFSTGIFARRILSDRFKLSAGLNYNRFTTSHAVGEKFDSSLSGAPGTSMAQQLESTFYRHGESGKYINRYHYIEMPVLLETNLFKRSKLPVTWNAGFSVSRLITGNQLDYDYTTGLYSEDNRYLNKTQLSVLMGLHTRLFNRYRFPLEIGPQVQYGLKNFTRKEINGNKHLVFFSLQANFILGRK